MLVVGRWGKKKKKEAVGDHSKEGSMILLVLLYYYFFSPPCYHMTWHSIGMLYSIGARICTVACGK